MQLVHVLHWYFLSFLIGTSFSYGDKKKDSGDPSFVTLKKGKFYIGKEIFYPRVLNYSVNVLQDYKGGYHVVPDIRQGWEAPGCGVGVSIGPDAESWRKEMEKHLHKAVELGFNSIRLVGLGFKYHDDALMLQGYWRQTGKNNPECYYYTTKPVLKLPDHKEMFGNFFAEVIEVIKADSLPLKLILVPARHLHEKKNDVITDYFAYLANKFKDEPTIMAWDLYNEPNFNYIVHNKGKFLTKYQAANFMNLWCDTIRNYAPNHLITFGPHMFDVFDWDADIMNIDFISLHVYPILKPVTDYNYSNGWLRYLVVLRNYKNTQTKPWIIGETGLPGADPQTGPYHSAIKSDALQAEFAQNSMRYASYYGAQGYSWWMLKDMHLPEAKKKDENSGRETSYGLIQRYNKDLLPKKAAYVFSQEAYNWSDGCDTCTPLPDDQYYNPWERNFYYVRGTVKDQRGRPIPDALIKYHTIKGPVYWTFSDKNGRFKAWCDAEDGRTLSDIRCSYPGKTTFYRAYSSGNAGPIDIVLENLDMKKIRDRTDR